MLTLLAIATATAATTPQVTASPVIDAAIRAHVASAVGVAEHDVEVHSNGVGRELACGPAASFDVRSLAGESFQRYAHLRLVGTDRGQVCEDLRVRAELVIWQHAPVAATSVAAGESVRLATERVERHRIQGVPVAPENGPFIAIAPLAAGAPVTTARVRTVPDWKSGSKVVLVARSGRLNIETAGRLLADARNGDTVRVANPATGAVIVGVISADGVVQAHGAER